MYRLGQKICIVRIMYQLIILYKITLFNFFLDLLSVTFSSDDKSVKLMHNENECNAEKKLQGISAKAVLICSTGISSISSYHLYSSRDVLRNFLKILL